MKAHKYWSIGAVITMFGTFYTGYRGLKEAHKYCTPNVIDAKVTVDGMRAVKPMSEWQLSDNAAYLHYCPNETIDGIAIHEEPDFGENVIVTADFSSTILSTPLDVSRYGVIYAGAQKNIGPAGLTIVIVREDLLGHALDICPSAFNYKTVADNNSMFNTPPTWGIYMAGLTFQWLKRQREGELTGVAAMEARNKAKADFFYDYLDHSQLYVNKVDKACRSRMNIPFFLRDESRNEAFLAAAKERGLLQLKGHKSVGGMRASIYNAMPVEGVQKLVDFMKQFETEN